MSVIDIRPFTEPHYIHYKYMMFISPIILDAKVIVETGFANGHSTNIFLSALSQLEGERKLHTYESFHNEDGNPQRIAAEKDIVDKNYRAKWFLHHQDSARSIVWDEGKAIDFLYLDSDHGLEHVYNELNAWMPFVTSKGLVMIDDAWDYNEQKAQGPCISSRRWMSEFGKEWKELIFIEIHGPMMWYR